MSLPQGAAIQRDAGGKAAEGETPKAICMVAVLTKLLASIIFKRLGAQETGK